MMSAAPISFVLPRRLRDLPDGPISHFRRRWERVIDPVLLRGLVQVRVWREGDGGGRCEDGEVGSPH